MRVTLHPVRADDLHHIYEWQRDAESVALAGVAARERDAFDAHWARILARPDAIARLIRADERAVGWAQSWRADEQRLIGYWIAREAWGRGIASAALPLLLREIEERPLHAVVRAQNVASRRVLERGGFAPDGGAEPGVLRYVLR